MFYLMILLVQFDFIYVWRGLDRCENIQSTEYMKFNLDLFIFKQSTFISDFTKFVWNESNLSALGFSRYMICERNSFTQFYLYLLNFI